MKALVYKSTGSWYLVRTETGERWNARMKGIFKTEGMGSTNPVAVGDEVMLEPEHETESSAMITEIFPRRNYIIRQAPSHKVNYQIVAANLDQCLLIATLREPKTSQGFIDRFLVACESYHIPAVILLNKSDLFRTREHERADEWRRMYRSVGYSVLTASIKENTGLAQVTELLMGKTTLFSGHSGVGKSSLINILLPSLLLKTQGVSGWSGKGIHTTTFAEMYDLEQGGRIIDTPGLREFGLVDISRQELSHYFPEMRDRIQDCQFNNCLHVNEPGCAIKKALGEGQIHVERYISYCNMLDSINTSSY
ncbi:MAG TPA: ribosome small subunit-dependent GTPase A [Puia sp.]|nr:ribosome small subunit-dependent GTPase A [Puia sp.]